ncbi:hypothetical protein TRP8649_04783 [Pelagimonas phthalicica]|uniref:Uncharacterized protein n=1 Tax=Pelagimonas phthalicica TaxID=1037362 RepID=A0A238JIZ5_9RHOB|nr:hypothetical protein TRP8649_04783 [Pelagimonas phthalicica]
MPGHAPKIGAVINVQRGLLTGGAGDGQRLERRGLDLGMRQMRARGDNRPRAADEIRVDILFGQPHIGAVLAVENQRKLFFVANAQQDQRGQTVRIGLDPVRIDPLALQLLANEPAHMLITNPGDHRRFQPQPRRATGNIGRAAADIFVKRPHILKPPTYLSAI